MKLTFLIIVSSRQALSIWWISSDSDNGNASCRAIQTTQTTTEIGTHTRTHSKLVSKNTAETGDMSSYVKKRKLCRNDNSG